MAIEGQTMMSKTQHYRKITKPLLERKRRARINQYLDELKDLIVETMEVQGDHVTKLEKADILEMTVQYLKTKQQMNCFPETMGINAEKFRAGYTQAAYEVSKVFASLPGMDIKFGTQLMKHLGYQLKDMDEPPKAVFSTPTSVSVRSMSHGKYDPSGWHDQDEDVGEPQGGGDVWRPW